MPSRSHLRRWASLRFGLDAAPTGSCPGVCVWPTGPGPLNRFGKVSAQDFGQMKCIACEDGIARQSAGPQDGIGEIAYKLIGVAPLDIQRCVNRIVDGLGIRHVE